MNEQRLRDLFRRLQHELAALIDQHGEDEGIARFQANQDRRAQTQEPRR